mgnify:CR=1 FL=1
MTTTLVMTILIIGALSLLAMLIAVLGTRSKGMSMDADEPALPKNLSRELSLADLVLYIEENEYEHVSILLNKTDKPLSEWLPSHVNNRFHPEGYDLKQITKFFKIHFKGMDVNFERVSFLFGSKQAIEIYKGSK